MEIGVLYLSHAMLVLAELIVCSTRGFACILAKWFWPTEISLSFTYGSPEAIFCRFYRRKKTTCRIMNSVGSCTQLEDPMKSRDF